MWRENHRDKQAMYRRRFSLSTYGLTEDEYGAMLAIQRGGCAMCGRTCPTGRQLAVDHDHLTGRVRGLLCVACNQALGVYEAIKDSASKYLDAYGEGNPHISHGEALAARRSALRARATGRAARLADDAVREIRTRYAAGGVTQRALAGEYGVSQNMISLILRGKVRPRGDDVLSGAAGSMPDVDRPFKRARRLTNEQITEARRRYDSGDSFRVIARRLGVHHTTIMRLLTGARSGAT